uniref:uncharacterized protein LOC124024442 n=1 Tax=Oncorhynchus gorbuscha TaxID=8017 RepID=UPI001EAEFE03|nr:uncharacterized protein LOC124024442 [Oncorhynchus gorbuscha]
MDISGGSPTFMQILRELPDLEHDGGSQEQNSGRQSPTAFFRSDIQPVVIKDVLWTSDTQEFDAILPFCTSAFSNSPQIQGTLTPSRHTQDPNKQLVTLAQVHCSESSPPENYCWAGNLLLHEPALQGQDCPETDPAESGTLDGKSHTPPVSAIRHNKRQKSRDSAPVKNGTDDHINLELGDSGAPRIQNGTPKRPVFNDISDVDDQLFCDAANLVDPVNSTASVPAAEQERFFTLFSRALKSRNVLLYKQLGDLIERQYRDDMLFWHRTIPRMLNSNPIKKRKYRR